LTKPNRDNFSATAALATPVLMTVALPATLLTASAMTDTAKAAAGAWSVQADYLVLPDGTAGLDAELTARPRAVPGAGVSTVTDSSVYTLEGDAVLIRRPAEGTESVPDDAIVAEPDCHGSRPDGRLPWQSGTDR
jgi:putative ABC transport system permease protein